MGDLRHFINEKAFKMHFNWTRHLSGSAEHYLKNNQIKLEWSIELFEALSYMHSKNIVHRDVNPKYFFCLKIKNF